MAQSQYAELADLVLVGVTPAARARFGDAAADATLQAASSIADSYIVSQFTLPLVTWDMSLKLCVCNIAAYLLYCQFGFNPAGANADQLIRTRYENALAYLAEIRDQKIHPQWTDSGGVTPIDAEAGAFIDSDPIVGFTPRGSDQTGYNTGADWFWDP